MQFVDALQHRYRLMTTRVPATWSHIEVKCPACWRVFVAWVSPREDSTEARQAARRGLLRTCPNHHAAFQV